jgi:hypothetical protein
MMFKPLVGMGRKYRRSVRKGVEWTQESEILLYAAGQDVVGSGGGGGGVAFPVFTFTYYVWTILVIDYVLLRQIPLVDKFNSALGRSHYLVTGSNHGCLELCVFLHCSVKVQTLREMSPTQGVCT